MLSGRDAELLPIVNNGKIEQVLVTNGGYEYNSPPNLVVNGVESLQNLHQLLVVDKLLELLLIIPELITQIQQLLV